MHLLQVRYRFCIRGARVTRITGRSRPPGGVGLTPRQYGMWRGALALLEDSLSVGAAACSALYCQCWEVYYQTSNYPIKEPKQPTTQPCAWVVYIAGDTLRHQPMGADHMTVLQFRGPITFCVLQWCHPMLART